MKEMPWRVSVEELNVSPHYGNLVVKIASLSPVIPPFNYEGQSNIEEIKFKLAQKAMHDLIMQHLKP